MDMMKLLCTKPRGVIKILGVGTIPAGAEVEVDAERGEELLARYPDFFKEMRQPRTEPAKKVVKKVEVEASNDFTSDKAKAKPKGVDV